MSNILFVHVTDGEEELLDSICGIALAKPLYLNDVVVELSARDKLSDNIEISVILQKFKDSHHVRVVRLLENIQLLLHQIDQYLVLPDVRLAHCLNGTCNASHSVQALAHLSKGPLAENPAHLVLLSYVLGVP